MIDKAQLLADLKAARRQGLLPMVVRIGKGDGTTIQATDDTGEPYTAWARSEDNGDPLVVYFTPGKVPLSWLAYNALMEVERNDRNQLEIERPYTGLRDTLGGASLPTNAYDWLHTHESDVEGGQLNASNIFDAGVVDEVYGGTGQAVYVVGDLLYASGTTTLARLAVGTNGNIYHVAGGVPVSGTLNLDTASLSGTLGLARGGTNADLNATGAGHLIQATAGANVSVIKDNFAATAAPTTGDDSDDGYAIGSLWLDTTNDNIYMAIDVSVGAAVWRKLDNATTAGGWTDDGTVVRLTTSTDNVSIGTASDIAKLGVVGDTDEPQLIVRGHATQTANILDIQNSTPSSLLKVTSSAIIFNDDSLDRDFIVEGNGDALLLNTEGANDRVGIGKVPALGKLDILGTADEPVLYLRPTALQSASIFTIVSGTGSTLMTVDPLGTLAFDGGAIFNESGASASLRVETNNYTHALYVLGNDDAVGINNSTPTAMLDIGASVSGQASFRIREGTAPSSPNSGDQWHSSANKAMYSRQGGMTHGQVNRIYGQYSTVGGSNTTSPIALIGGSAIGSATIPADMWFAGRAFKLEAKGYISTGGIARDITITIALGGTTLVSQALTGLSIVTLGRMWWVDLDFVCQTTGSSGTVFSQAFGSIFNTLLDRFENTATSTHNMTGNLTLTFPFTFATANSNTQIQCTNLNLYAMN